MGERLSDRLVRELPAPEKGNRVYYDGPSDRGSDWTPGFGLRVTATGARSFILNFRNKDGTERRHTIGRYPAWTLLAARDEAKRLKREIDGGGDPVAKGRELRSAPTVADLCERFRQEHIEHKRPSTARDYKSLVGVIEREIGNRKVAAVDFADIERLHRAITRDGTPYRANRVVAVASKMFSLAVRWKMRTDNPCRGIERNTEEKRERYLSEAELARLIAALDAHLNQQAADVFRLLMWTGARCGEALAATWDQFNDEFTVWRKPAAYTKQKKTHVLPLAAPAQQLLLRLYRKRAEGENRVFPQPGSLKREWRAICRAAKLTNFRIHDLRHNYASALASSGYSLPVIGKLLGHTQAATTERYAHLIDNVLVEAAATAGAVLTGKRSAKVVPLRGWR
jgi:integrase